MRLEASDLDLDYPSIWVVIKRFSVYTAMCYAGFTYHQWQGAVTVAVGILCIREILKEFMA